MAKKKNATPIKKISIDDNSVFIRNEDDFLITEVDGEAVMMNTLNGTYWGLNSSTTDIWNILETPMTYPQIVDKLLHIYTIDKDTCTKETLQVLINMTKVRVLKLDI